MVENNQILYLSFNFDNSFFAVGTETGFKVYLTETLKLKFDRNLGGGIALIQMLNDSNIFCLGGGGKSPKYAPNKLLIWDDIQAKEVLEYRFNSYVLNCKIKRERLFVVTHDEISIIDLIETMDVIETIKTCENIYGACSISKDPENYLFAWPDTNIGYIEIKNFKNDNEFIIDDVQKTQHIQAHKNMVEIIEINFKGNKLASSNEKGNLIKIFDINNGNLIHELRRGTEQAKIYDISFDINDNYLAVSSDRPTIHIFTLINENNDNKGNNDVKNTKSMFNGISKMLGVKILQSEWSFAQVKVPSNSKSIVSLFSDQNKIVIVNNQGKYISAVYNTKSESNVECKITKSISIFNIS